MLEKNTPHSDEQDAVNHFIETVKSGTTGNPWLGVYVEIQEDGSLKLHRTTWQFPTGRFVDVLSSLTVNLGKVIDESKKEEPARIPLSDYLSLQQELQRRQESLQLPKRDDDPVHVTMDDVVTESLEEEEA